MTGFLLSSGVPAGETRVGRTLRQCHEPYNRARQHVLYRASVLSLYGTYFQWVMSFSYNASLSGASADADCIRAMVVVVVVIDCRYCLLCKLIVHFP